MAQAPSIYFGQLMSLPTSLSRNRFLTSRSIPDISGDISSIRRAVARLCTIMGHIWLRQGRD